LTRIIVVHGRPAERRAGARHGTIVEQLRDYVLFRGGRRVKAYCDMDSTSQQSISGPSGGSIPGEFCTRRDAPPSARPTDRKTVTKEASLFREMSCMNMAIN